MITTLRVTLFGSFAAIGVGVALCLGLSQPADDEHQVAPAGQLAARLISENDSCDEVNDASSESLAAEPSKTRADAVSPDAKGDAAPRASTPTVAVQTSGSDCSAKPANAFAESRLGTAPVSAPMPPATAPDVPILVESNPAIAKQVLPPGDDGRLQQAYEFLRQQLSGAGGMPVPKPPAAGEVQAPALGVVPAPPPAPDTKANNLPSRAKVDAEGDGKLTIHIQNCELREVLDLLSEQGSLNILAGTSVQGKVSATLNGVDIDSALDAILRSTGLVARREGKFIFVGSPREFEDLEHTLDRIGTRVYRPNYVNAAELQKLIQPVLTEKIGAVTVSSPAEAGIPSDTQQAGGDKFAGGDVLLVRDYEAVLAMVDQVVAEVDVRPTQVHIEAMILSVHLKDTDKYGVNFQFLRDNPHINFAIGNPPATVSDFGLPGGGLKFGYLDGNLGVFLEALETIGDTDVIATPRLMVLNKQRAEVQIGQSMGYVSTTVTETSSTQAVQFLDVGALLRLRPYVSSDGLIRMEIHPELSDGTVKTENGFTLPQKEVTQVTTNIMVHDGCTVVIGGLLRENLSNTATQVPLLGNLPVVGFLFRNTTQTTERREVIVLITPHIVYEPGTCQEGEKAACEFHRRQSLYADKMSPLNKRSLGRRFFRLAQSAWATGDRDTALRFAEMSVQFDPLNRAAIDLRSDIWLGKQGDHTLITPGGAANPLDDPQTMGQMLDEVERPPKAPCAALHPLDAGQPGRHTDIARPSYLQ